MPEFPDMCLWHYTTAFQRNVLLFFGTACYTLLAYFLSVVRNKTFSFPVNATVHTLFSGVLFSGSLIAIFLVALCPLCSIDQCGEITLSRYQEIQIYGFLGGGIAFFISIGQFFQVPNIARSFQKQIQITAKQQRTEPTPKPD